MKQAHGNFVATILTWMCALILLFGQPIHFEMYTGLLPHWNNTWYNFFYKIIIVITYRPTIQ